MNTYNRRTFLTVAAGAAAARPSAAADPIPIIDTHLHLFDPTRPQGVPYPKVPDPPRQLPSQYREDVAPLGIVGGIEVEASPWIEDNLWILEAIRDEPIIVGTIGNINPTRPDFREFLERYHRNKLFLGIRYGNVWEGDSLVAALDKPEFLSNMKLFAQTGLTLEVANPRFELIEGTLRLTDKVPELRVVLGHLQALPLPTAPDALKHYAANLRDLRARKVFAKVSGLPRPADGQTQSVSYKPMFDFIWDIFGDDFVVFAAGWSRMPQQPSSLERMKERLKIFQTYVAVRGRPAAEKFFWQNSIRAFRWVRRDPRQPQLA